MMNNNLILETYNKLDEFRNEAACWYSEAKAFKILTELKRLLLMDEYNELSIAFSHVRTGEGTTELFSVCKKLMQKYK